jgi:hypothetical protein
VGSNGRAVQSRRLESPLGDRGERRLREAAGRSLDHFELGGHARLRNERAEDDESAQPPPQRIGRIDGLHDP